MRLGVDFGTSHTVAVLSRPDGRAEPLLFDASPLLPSAVFAPASGDLLTGRDAERSARLDPAAFEPHPKRRIDDTGLLLGERDLPVVELVEAVLRRVGEEATRALGGNPPHGTVLTHPAAWGGPRRALLIEAASRAGLPAPVLVPEPVAAAMYFTTVLGHPVADGHAIVVYDFGGGTFDISVVRRRGTTWEVAAAQGLDDVGGVDLDAAIVDWIGAQVSPADPALWSRLHRPAATADRRLRRALWDDARAVKELLSRAASGGIAVPLFERDLILTRPEFEALARPWLDRTVALTTATLFTSGVTADRLAGVFLVGGASRVPLVATLLHRGLGVPPVVLEQPELVVALGSLLVPPPPVVATPAPVPPVPAPAPLPPPEPAVVEEPDVEVPDAAPPRRRRSPVAIAWAAVTGLGLLGLLVQSGTNFPPLRSAVFVPLTPKPLLVIAALALIVAITPRKVPAFRALAPALLVTGGGIAALFVAGQLISGGNAVRFAGRTMVPVASSGYFDEASNWIFTVLVTLLIPLGIYLLARRPAADPVPAPATRGRRWAWAGLWALGGVVYMLATVSPIAFLQHGFGAGDSTSDVAPAAALNYTGGPLSWWAAFTFGTLLAVGAWLLAGAAVRPLLARASWPRFVAGALIAAAGVVELVLANWDRQLWAGNGYQAVRLEIYYWQPFIYSTGPGLPRFFLILTLAIFAGVAVTSFVRARAATRR